MPRGIPNKPKVSAPAPTGIRKVELVRKNLKSGKLTGRKPGRPGPSFEIGHTINGEYRPGNPPAPKRRRRSQPSAKVIKLAKAKPAKKAGMSELEKVIEQIIDKKLNEKLASAKAAAIDAISATLTV